MPTVALPHGGLHYAESGAKSAPALVFCHALGTDLTLWDAQSDALASRFRVIRFDLRGHGESSAPASPYTIDGLAADVVGLLDALSVSRAHVCGLSIGGILALAVALRAPQRVGRLVVANTAARIGTREGWEDRIANVRETGLEPVANAAIERWFTEPFQAREPALMERFRAHVRRTNQDAYIGCCAALRDADLRPELARIASETLAIAGLHDGVTTAAHAAEIARGVQRGRTLDLDAAHLSNVEAEGAFTDALRDFLI